MQKKLVIIWLSVERAAAIDMALLYGRDSLLNGWWEEVELVLWGPPVEAATQSEAIAHEIKLLQSVGGHLSACLACAVRYGVTQKLMDMGLDVKGMGERLTEYLKDPAISVIFI